MSHDPSHDVSKSLHVKSYAQTIVGHVVLPTRSSTQGTALVHNLGRTQLTKG